MTLGIFTLEEDTCPETLERVSVIWLAKYKRVFLTHFAQCTCPLCRTLYYATLLKFLFTLFCFNPSNWLLFCHAILFVVTCIKTRTFSPIAH